MPETWYVLEDGSVVDPAEVSRGKGGRLHHKSGAAVAMRGDVARTRSVDAEAERAKAAKKAAASKVSESPPKADRQMKADSDGVKYKTR